MSYLNPHTHNLDGPDADGTLRTNDRPRIVCLCGSTRFKAEFEQANRDLTLAGRIVIAPGVFGHADGITLTPTEKAELDRLHLHKIAMSDAVFVVNPGGYIGDSTRNEITYAKRIGVPVRYLEGEAPDA